MNNTNNDKTLHLKWKSHTTYTIAMLSWTMGLTNILHAPHFIIEIGFWNFLAGHTFIMVIMGIPLTVVEIALSQYSSKSLVQCWDFCPFFKGIGYGKIMLLTIFQVYYNVLNSYLLFYCFTVIPKYQNLNDCNTTSTNCSFNNSFTEDKYLSDAEKFWYSEVITMNKHVDYLGDLNWELMYYLLGHMVLVFLFNVRGIPSLELTLPFTFGLSLLEYGIFFCVVNTVPGAWNGIKDMFSARFNINTLLLWKKEAVLHRVFQNYLYSMGLTFGGFSSIASQGFFRKPIYRIAIWTNLINLATSIFYAAIFANIFGVIYHYSTTSMKRFHSDNIDLYDIFIVIPNSLNHLPGSTQGWQFVFYSSIYLRGLCSAVLMASAILSAIYEVRPKLCKFMKTCCLIFCLITYFIGCLLHTNYGPMIGNQIRSIASTIILPTLTSFQIISVVMVYGLLKFTEDLHFMTGYVPAYFCFVCLIITVCMVPFLTIMILTQYFINTTLTSHEMVLQKIIMAVILIWIPFMNMVRIIRKKKWKIVLGPSKKWILPDELERSRQLFKEENCVEEFLYEKYVLEEKLKKYK